MVGRKEVPALAANRDGVFVALQLFTLYGKSYTVTVQKYTHEDGSPVVSAINVLSEETDDNKDWLRPGNLTALHIQEGILYGLTAVQYRYDKESNGVYRKNSISGKLVKIGGSTAGFSGEAEVLHTTELNNIYDPDSEADAKREEGGKFAPYRFIAVKPKKLIIASDGFWGEIDNVNNTNNDTVKQFNFIWDFSIKPDGLPESTPQSEKVEYTFSKQLKRDNGSNFVW